MSIMKSLFPGVAGFCAVITLEKINEVLATLIAVLTVAHLVYKLAHDRRQRQKDKV